MKAKKITLENALVAFIFIGGFAAIFAVVLQMAAECDDGKLSSCAILAGSL